MPLTITENNRCDSYSVDSWFRACHRTVKKSAFIHSKCIAILTRVLRGAVIYATLKYVVIKMNNLFSAVDFLCAAHTFGLQSQKKVLSTFNFAGSVDLFVSHISVHRLSGFHFMWKK